MRKFLLLIIPFLMTLKLNAQDSSTLSGTVKNIDDQPMEFVNAMLLNFSDSSLVKGAISDANGIYKFEDIDAGNYIVMLSQVGFSKHYSEKINFVSGTEEQQVSPAIILENTVQLKEANVVALRPFIERRVDKTIVNIENSIIDAGSTALEILKRSPGIVVDNDGNISLKGKQGVLVLIDEKPTYLSANDLYNMLRNMSSDQLSSIEIITNPSSRYDASGNSGIVNIRLKKKQNLGMNGSATLSYGQGRYPDFGGGVNLNYRNERFNFFGNYNYMYGYYFEEIELNRRFIETDHTSQFIQNNFDKGRYINNNFRGGLDYFITDRQTLGFQIR
ncbi:MAG TPA: TonB-dependent receptor, partial [Bacteroidia bacterium]|nr:TonB-dependent receptor [Bacteroidia bacterium]